MCAQEKIYLVFIYMREVLRLNLVQFLLIGPLRCLP